MATWVTILLLAPFWWACGLILLALFGDLFPSRRARVSTLLDRLERK